MIKELSAGLIIFRRSPTSNETLEYLLLQKETHQHHHEHHWTFPKGHLDHGETDLEAAIRETQEEAGLREHDFNLITEFKIESSYISRKGISKTVWYWIAEIVDPHVEINLSHSHKQYKWLKLNDALQLVKYESMKAGLVKANEFLLNRHK